MYTTLEEKIAAMYENEAMDRYVTGLEDAYDRGDFELPDEYEDLTVETVLKMVNSVDHDTFIDICRENLRQNAEMTVELLAETMEQVQGAYDALDEENRKQFATTVAIGTEAAAKMWEENANTFKKLINELPEDQRAALVTNSAANVVYLHSDRVPSCVKPWASMFANMWQLVYDFAA